MQNKFMSVIFMKLKQYFNCLVPNIATIRASCVYLVALLNMLDVEIELAKNWFRQN